MRLREPASPAVLGGRLRRSIPVADDEDESAGCDDGVQGKEESAGNGAKRNAKGQGSDAQQREQLLVPVDQVGERGHHDEDHQDDSDSTERVVVQGGELVVVPERKRQQRGCGDQRRCHDGGASARRRPRRPESEKRAGEDRDDDQPALLEGERERRCCQQRVEAHRVP